MDLDLKCTDCSGFVMEGHSQDLVDPRGSQYGWRVTPFGWCQLYHYKRTIDGHTPMCSAELRVRQLEASNKSLRNRIDKIIDNLGKMKLCDNCTGKNSDTMAELSSIILEE